MQVLAGAVLAAAVSLVANRTHILTQSGAIAAFFIGTIIFGLGGWPYAALLFAFFIPSAALSRLGRERKKALADVGKQGARDAWQVLANGGLAAACVVAGAVTHDGFARYAYAGALAAASSDTWGTEIGTLARMTPRSILTFAPIPAGFSGGVTLIGTVAEVAGAAVLALIAAALAVGAALPILAAGFAGALIDSFLGATLQTLWFCGACGRACETNPHHCGTPATLIRGVRWMNNDAVNFCATLAGAAIAVLLSRLL
ncbi:MAG TPA: DUF92 domain-containing protein [Candidatus Baltobacteraceae bacterium]|nr:DUF92 domain-containing protein [Candidatus Baltobacteraceae bacterium]